MTQNITLDQAIQDYRMRGQQLTAWAVREALQDPLADLRAWERVADMYAMRLGVNLATLQGKHRNAFLMNMRFVITEQLVAHQCPRRFLHLIWRRDRTTIIHYRHQAAALANDPEIKRLKSLL